LVSVFITRPIRRAGGALIAGADAFWFDAALTLTLDPLDGSSPTRSKLPYVVETTS